MESRVATSQRAATFDLGESKAALVMIDMQHGFIDPASSLCIAGAQATIPACARALDHAREVGIPVIYALRRYAADGSDVEAARYDVWATDRALSDACADPRTCEVPVDMAPKGGDSIIWKPRYSAFWGTGLDALLRRLDVWTVILAGTTTPNCVRSSCYDAMSLDYNVVVLSDATSSRDADVQRANLEDMAVAGAHVIDVARFCERGLSGLTDQVRNVRAAVEGTRHG